MADRIKGITIEIGGDTTKLSKALEGVNRDLKTARTGLKDVDRLLKFDPSNVELLRQKQGYLNDAIDSTKKKLEQERDALNQMKNTEGFDKNSEQAKALERQIAADEQALKNLQKQSKEFGSVGAQQFKLVGDAVKQAGDKISNIGKEMSMKVTAPIVGVGAASMAAWKEVDAGMDIVVQKTGATGERFEQMKGIVENIATSIPTDFETVGNAVGEVATRFGVTGEELEALSTQFIQFAELNGTEVTGAIDTAQKALAAFGLDAQSAGGLLDALNITGQATGASMDSLLNGLVQNGTAFQEMGLSIEQATMFMGQMETSGANSETVMNGLRKALKNAAEDGVPLNDALAQLQDTIVNGTDRMDGLTAAYDLFGKSGDQIYGAVKNGTLDFTALAEAANMTGTSVAETFEATKDPADDFKTAMNQAKIAGADLGTALQTTVAPMIQKVSEVIQSLTEKFRALSPEQQEMIVKIGLVVAAIGPALTVIGSLVSGIGTLISVVGTIVGILGGPLTIAIGAAIAIGVALYKNWDTVKEKAGQLFVAIKEKFEAIKEAIRKPIEAAKEAVHNAIEKIKGFFNFEFTWPKLKMPHFSVSGSMNPLKWLEEGVPKIQVEWYRKAYDNPVMFTTPTVLATPNGYKGFGDGSGAEIVMGLNKLKEMVGSGGGNVNITVYGAQGQDVKELAAEIERRMVQAQRSQRAVFA